MLKKLSVDLGTRSYPIFIEDGALTNPSLWQECLVKRGKVVIVTNETVQKWYLEPLRNSLKSIGVEALSCVLPDGEQYKDLEHFNEILTFLLENSAGRDSTIFVFIFPVLCKAKNLLLEEYPLAEKSVHKVKGEWVFDGYIHALPGAGRFVTGLAQEVEILEGDELKEYVRSYMQDALNSSTL